MQCKHVRALYIEKRKKSKILSGVINSVWPTDPSCSSTSSLLGYERLVSYESRGQRQKRRKAVDDGRVKNSLGLALNLEFVRELGTSNILVHPQTFARHWEGRPKIIPLLRPPPPQMFFLLRFMQEWQPVLATDSISCTRKELKGLEPIIDASNPAFRFLA